MASRRKPARVAGASFQPAMDALAAIQGDYTGAETGSNPALPISGTTPNGSSDKAKHGTKTKTKTASGTKKSETDKSHKTSPSGPASVAGASSEEPGTPTCCLKSCSRDISVDGNEGSKVEVKTIVATEQVTMQVTWGRGGEAVFHRDCWKKLVGALKTNETLELGEAEKAMVEEANKTAEYFDSRDKIATEGARIAEMIKNAKYVISFTGAGISTAAGIGDFRGKGGKWTERDRAKVGAIKATRSKVAFEDLRPTYTHEALLKMLDVGYLKHIISQNTDSLHRLSGIPAKKISELHGNSFLEKCEKCGTRFERTYRTRGKMPAGAVPPLPCKQCRINHRTGRVCEKQDCDGYLMNTIINFGDNLESAVLAGAVENAERNDLVLCLGSTLMVSPACDLVAMGADPIKLVICNRQPTPFDSQCQNGSRIFGDCDNLMKEIMRHLLGEKEARKWEESLPERRKSYDQLRTGPK